MRRGITYLISALLIATAAASAGAAFGAPAQQTGSCDGSAGVYLYESRNYGGRCVRLTGDVADLSTISFNNIATSVRIIGDYTAVLYVDQNYGNVASALGVDSPDLNDSVVDDNRASSVRVISGYRQTGDDLCRGDGIYLYEGTGYQGRCVRYTGDESDLGDQRFDNQVSSVRVVGSYSATIYSDDGYQGAQAAVNQSIDNLSTTGLGNRRASSIRVSRGGASSCSGDGVYLFEHPNYQGRCVRLTADAPDLRTLGFDDTASSVRVVGGFSATLFRDLSGAGQSTTFTADDPNLADNPIGDNQATSARVSRTQAPPPPASNCSGEGVYLYEHPNYQGRCARFTADSGDLRTVAFDDAASSIRIVGGYTAVLFRDLNGTGQSTTFAGDDANLADNPIGDNQATSIRVTRGTQTPPAGSCSGEGVYLFEHPNYQGRCVRFTADNGDLRTVAFDDAASSIRIVGGYTAVLFRDLSGTGQSTTFTGDDANLFDNPIGDNQVTSIRVTRGGAPPAPAPAPAPGGQVVGACDGNEGVYLYEGTNYDGACIRLTGDVIDLRPYGLDDAASSVRVFGRWSVTLFRDLSYTGANSTFVESDSDLRNDGIGTNQATSAIVRRR